MTTIRAGKYISKINNTAFLPYGKKTLKDSLVLTKTNDSTLNFTRFRRRYDSTIFKNIIKYETNSLKLNYIDNDHKELGGRVKVYTREFNVANLQPYSYYMYGYFNRDELVFAKFRGHIDLTHNENSLFEVTKEDIQNTDIVFRLRFQLANEALFYRVDVNQNLRGEHHEWLEESHTELVPANTFTWTDRLFYQAV